MTDPNDFDATSHFSGDHALVYDEKIQDAIPGYRLMHELAYYLLKDNLPENANILISGSGTGHEAITYAQNQKHWQMTGVDPTPQMVDCARKKVTALGLSDRIRLIESKVTTIPEKEFDAATSILVMQFLKDNGEKEEYLQEIACRLKEGGWLILIDLEGEKGSRPCNLLLSAWKTQQSGTRKDKEQVEQDFAHIDTDLQLISEKRLTALCKAANLNKICKFYQSYLFGGYLLQKRSAFQDSVSCG